MCYGFYGMTLRDWFASQAMPSCIEEVGQWNREILEKYGYSSWYEGAAGEAYKWADAMLKENNRNESRI